jgi:hypothetical protein
MKISTNKTMRVCKEPLRCKLEVQGKITEQVMSFKYLGVKITSNGVLQLEVKHQAYTGTRVSGCLNGIIWQNIYLSLEFKARICRLIVRPVLT